MRSINSALQFFLLFLIALLPAYGWSAEDADKTFSQAELDQMMAPVALYPDALLSQLLMASTYPDQVAEAAEWSKANSDKKGDDAVTAVQDKAWDPSVASLVAFPQVLAMMRDKPDWVKQMGDAFLADPEAVMNTVQGLRKKAKDAGNLESSDQQKVVVDSSSSQTVIMVESTDPKVVYVPVYNPTVIYGSWWWPTYPPFYWPPPPGYGFAAGVVSGIGFGIGIAITNSIWGGFDWHHHDVNINVNRYNKINVNNRIDVNKKTVSWNHNAINRKGTPYVDSKSRQKYGQKLDGADKREDFRGRDLEREQAKQAMEKRGLDPAAERGKLTGAAGDKVRGQLSTGTPQRARDSGARRMGDSGDLRSASPKSRDVARSSNAGRDNALSGLGDRSGGRMSDTRGGFSTRSMGGGGLGGRGGRGGRR